MSKRIESTTIDLLRHGACDGGEIFRGSTNVTLTETGWQQMRTALAAHGGWDRVVSSSLQRCADFAGQFAEQNSLPLRIENDFREFSFGDWEGRRIADIEREHGDLLRNFWNDPLRFSPPNAEPLNEFRLRVMNAADKILREHRGEHVLLISHGAVIRMMLCEWLQMSMNAFSTFSVPYASLSRIRIYHTDNKPDWLQLVFHRGE
jgi:broad specificity phosphatase PhoE